MVRGTRSSQADTPNDQSGAQEFSEMNGSAPLVTPQKRTSASPQVEDSNMTGNSQAQDLSPAKRTRGQLSRQGLASPHSEAGASTSVSPQKNMNSVPGEETSLRSSGRTTRALAHKGNDGEVADTRTSARTRSHDQSNKSNPGRKPTRPSKGAGTSHSEHRSSEAVSDLEGLVDHATLFDDLAEADKEEDVLPGVLTVRQRKELLGVLLAMETAQSIEHQSDRPKSRPVKILDIFFPLGDKASDVAASENGLKHQESNGDIKMEGQETEAMPKRPMTTLRKLLGRLEDPVTVRDLIDNLSELSQTITPNLPNPFADLLPESPSALVPKPSSLAPRLTGSRIKQDKDLPVHEHLQSVRDIVTLYLGSCVASQDPDHVKSVHDEHVQLAPQPKFKWALHQRTTVPWPIPPRTTGRGDRQPPPVQPTDRVHLDWFTSAIATGDGSMKDVLNEGKENGDGTHDDEVDVGRLAKLQVEGFMALGDVAAVPPPDRQNEELDRSKGPKLGELLLSNASKKAKKYRQVRRERAQAGRPMEFLHHVNSFTPSFAPTYDSTMATHGWNYENTIATSRMLAGTRQWFESGWNANYTLEDPALSTSIMSEKHSHELDDQQARQRAVETAQLVVDDDVIDPSLIAVIQDEQSRSRAIQDQLAQNVEWLKQLATRQSIRLRRGQRDVQDAEEHVIASNLFKSLTSLAMGVEPRALLPPHPTNTASPPLAPRLAQTLVRTPSQVYRGTLDPARPKAMAENYTVVTRPEIVPPGPISRSRGPPAAVQPPPPPQSQPVHHGMRPASPMVRQPMHMPVPGPVPQPIPRPMM